MASQGLTRNEGFHERFSASENARKSLVDVFMRLRTLFSCREAHTDGSLQFRDWLSFAVEFGMQIRNEGGWVDFIHAMRQQHGRICGQDDVELSKTVKSALLPYDSDEPALHFNFT